LYSRRP